MARSSTKQAEPGREELRQQIADEARRLRSVAASVRAGSSMPELSAYVRSGRGPAYQRDYRAWMRSAHAAAAFDQAAYQLEQVLESALL